LSIRVVKMEREHIDQVVQVHLRAFTEFFTSFLGPGFLREFYRSFTEDPMGIGLVAEDTESRKVVGSVAGPLSPAGYFKRLLKRRWWAFCLGTLWAALKRPSIVPRLFRAMFYRGESPSGPDRALLCGVSVDPDAQRRGIGKTLVDAWAAEVRRRGGTGCFLVTDAHDNEAVNQFYAKCGWRVESTFARPDGRVMNRYVFDFQPQDREAKGD